MLVHGGKKIRSLVTLFPTNRFQEKYVSREPCYEFHKSLTQKPIHLGREKPSVARKFM